MHPQQPSPYQLPGYQPAPQQPLGPLPRVHEGAKAIVLVALLLALLGMSVWGGYEVGLHDSGRLQALLFFLPAIACLVGVSFIWLNSAFQLRSDGRVLLGRGALGPLGLDLSRLSSVAAAVSRSRTTLVLRDDVGLLAVDVRALTKAGQPVFDAVGLAIWQAQERGALVTPIAVAAIWGMPPRPGAAKRGKPGTTAPALLGVLMMVSGLVVGLILGVNAGDGFS